MARRRRSSPSVSLFPFLSILACIIGSLTLIIAGLTVGEMAQPEDAEDARRAAEHARLTGETLVLSNELKRLSALIEQALAVEERLREAQAELDRLKARARTLEATDRERLDLLGRIAKLRKEIEQLEADLKRLQEEIERLKAILRNRPDTATQRIRVLATGSGRNLRPYFVECTADSLIVHPEMKRIRVSAVKSDATFRSLMSRVKGERKGTLIFLIRPDGVKTFDQSRRVAMEQKVRHGKIPLPGQQPLDLSQFGIRPGPPGSR